MIAAIVGLLMIPGVVILDYLKWLKSMQPLERELTHASHGAVIVIFALTEAPKILPPHYRFYTIIVLLGWGAFWFVIGASRSRGLRYADLIGRAAVKVGVGFIAYVARFGIAKVMHDALSITPPITLFLVEAIAFFLVVTGLVKMMLLMRGRRVLRGPTKTRSTPYGGARFADFDQASD